MHCSPKSGFTIVEMLVVVVILAFAAGISYTSFVGNSDEYRVNAASTEILNALRFARSEAILRNEHTAVAISNRGRIRVFSVDISGSVPVTDAKLLHPLNGHKYDLTLHKASASKGVQFDTNNGNVFGNGTASSTDTVFFNASGRPYVIAPGNSPSYLRAVNLTISKGSYGRQLKLDPVAGRATAPVVGS